MNYDIEFIMKHIIRLLILQRQLKVIIKEERMIQNHEYTEKEYKIVKIIDQLQKPMKKL